MQISEHVHAIKIPFKVTNELGVTLDRFVYTYLIIGKEICLLDSGVAGSENIIYNYMASIGMKPDNISMMILSHSHPDHIGSAHTIKEGTGCSIAAHKAEKQWIEDVELQYNERPVPNFHSLVEGPVKIDSLLEDGDSIDLGNNVCLEVIHTPGQSKGSISLYFPIEGLIFTGDSIPLKGDLPIYEDVVDSFQSIEMIKSLKEIQILLASWDEPRKGDEAYLILDNGLEYLQKIQKAVLEVAEENKTSNYDSLDFSRLVLSKLGLPEMVVNPIIAQSFKSNLHSTNINKKSF